MKVELVPHTGMRYDDVLVTYELWQVFATGSNGNRVLVAYLSHDPEVPLMVTCNQPWNILKEIVEKCEAITGRKVIPPEPIYEPPEIDNDAGEDDNESDE